MDIAWYRNKIMHVEKYSSPKWHERVSRMKPAQVIAIYNNFKEKGLFDKKKKRDEKEPELYYQFTIWDYLMEDDLK